MSVAIARARMGVLTTQSHAVFGDLLMPPYLNNWSRVNGVLAFALLTTIAVMPAQAWACGGPCATPSLWDVQEQDGAPLVVTNFGLLTEGDTGWTLICEERIGGLILDARASGQRAFVSTDLGLFAQTGAACDWQPGPASQRSDWLLSYVLAPTGADEPAIHLALVYDPESQVTNLERAVDGAFEIVRPLEQGTSYRQLQSGPDMQSVFVAGYATEERTWNVTFSLDRGESWQDATPAFDNASVALYLRYVDPEFPTAALVLAQSTLERADELWRFDSSSGELSQLLVLNDEQVVSGVTAQGDWLWVAARNRQYGSLYRTRRDTLAFTQVVEEGPPYSCLSSIQGALYACVDDFTRESEFILGVSDDDGAHFRAHMTVEDLGKVIGCGTECSLTTDWLHSTYAVAGDSGVATDAPSGADSSNNGRPGRSGCALAQAFWVGHSPEGSCRALLVGLLAVAAARRRVRKRALLRKAGLLAS